MVDQLEQTGRCFEHRKGSRSTGEWYWKEDISVGLPPRDDLFFDVFFMSNPLFLQEEWVRIRILFVGPLFLLILSVVGGVVTTERRSASFSPSSISTSQSIHPHHLSLQDASTVELKRSLLSYANFLEKLQFLQTL